MHVGCFNNPNRFAGYVVRVATTRVANNVLAQGPSQGVFIYEWGYTADGHARQQLWPTKTLGRFLGIWGSGRIQ